MTDRDKLLCLEKDMEDAIQQEERAFFSAYDSMDQKRQAESLSARQAYRCVLDKIRRLLVARKGRKSS